MLVANSALSSKYFSALETQIVLGEGKRCRSDIKIVRSPDRYVDDKDDGVFFAKVMGLLAEAEAAGS